MLVLAEFRLRNRKTNPLHVFFWAETFSKENSSHRRFSGKLNCLTRHPIQFKIENVVVVIGKHITRFPIKCVPPLKNWLILVNFGHPWLTKGGGDELVSQKNG